MNKILKLSALTLSIASLYGCNSESTENVEKSSEKNYFALIEKITLPEGNEICSVGGIQLIIGYDENNNNILDDNEKTTDKSICNDGSLNKSGEDETLLNKAIVNIGMITKGDSQCELGGQEVIYGVDKNGNATLEADEVEDNIVLCAKGEITPPDALINALTTTNSITEPNSTITIEALVSNIPENSTFEWTDDKGNLLTPENLSKPELLKVTLGKSEGTETYKLRLSTFDDNGNKSIQTKKISINVSYLKSEVTSIALNSKQVYLPESYQTKSISGDITGAVIYAKPITKNAQAKSITTPELTELLGFVSERPALNQGKNANEILSNAINSLNSSIKSISEYSKTVLSNGDISASYNIELFTSKKPTELLTEIMQKIAINKINGKFDTLIPAKSEQPTENFQFDISISFSEITKTAVITSTLVAKDKSEVYSDLIASTTSESVTAPIGTSLIPHKDTYTAAEQKTAKSDFLFVIDNSGSMGGEQDEISKLTTDFIDTMNETAIDFNVAVITTDSDTLRGKGFTNDKSQIEKDLKPGTNGSGIEKGIYFAEKALAPTTGTVAIAGYPRQGASLSVIIMSDEKSQYGSNPKPFDPKSNLFVDNQYKVYAIVQPQHAEYSQYDDLANETLGKSLNINEKNEYKTFVELIAKNSGVIAAGYHLSMAKINSILSSSIAVTVDGQLVTRSKFNGWEYYPLAQKVIFTGAAIPTAGAKIEIGYQYVENKATPLSLK
ncbi:vWA domain-containing protein [Photobacterium leiognathi]|uniref:vWA domain-containing protein n=1 Tax=Photobacterium leiognathi TaxID=553611 RepID=UPI002981013A|nr:VWA domain-containing protein [Photobacterium leiognathi]